MRRATLWIKQKKNLFKILFVLMIMLLAIQAGIISGYSYSENPQTTYALGQSSVTSLSTGNGLVEGKNRLRLGDIAEQTISASGISEASEISKQISINHDAMPDLFISGHIKANKGVTASWWEVGIPPYREVPAKYSPSGAIYNTSDGGSKDLIIKTYPRGTQSIAESDIVISSRVKVSQELKNAILDPMLTVNANVTIVTKNLTESDAWGTVTLKSSYDNTSVSESMSFTGTSSKTLFNPLVLNDIGDDSYLEFKINELHHDHPRDGTTFAPHSVNDYTKTGINIHFDDIFIDITIEANKDLSYRQTKDNFGDVEIIGIDRDTECAKDFVKPGDYVYVSTSFQTNSYMFNMSYNKETHTPYVTYRKGSTDITVINEFRNYFVRNEDDNGNVMGSTENYSTIEWSFNSDYVERIKDEEFDITGQTAKFRVKDTLEPALITKIKFTPYLRAINLQYPDNITSITRINSENPYITLRGDAGPPNRPEISSSDPFFENIITQKQWYSTGFVDDGDRRGVEVEVNFTSASFNNGQGSRLKLYYTTDDSNPEDSETRVRLLEEPITSSTSTKVKLFFPLPITTRQYIFKLQIIAYDLAGNKSPIRPYEEIKIDCTDYMVNIYFMQGDMISYELANSSTVNQFGLAQLGTYVSEYDKNYSSTKQQATRAYRRGDLVYIRLTFKKASEYRLFQYYNSGIRNYVDSSINYGNFAAGEFGDFKEKSISEVYFFAPGNNTEVAIELTDEMVSNLNNLNFYFLFKQKLNIMVGATETVYDGTPKGIEQPTTNLSGIDIETYYKENIEDEFTSTQRFTDAGNYFFRCEILNNNYYGSVEGIFIIKKANPFVTGIEVLDITYGVSMGSAGIRCKNTDPNTPDQLYNSNWSSDRKVAGNFEITYPVNTSMAYQNPSQGLKDITVTFYPGPDYDKNYNSVPLQTTLYVNHSTMLDMMFDESTFNYTYQKDMKRYVSVITNPPNQILIIEYKREGQPDNAYTTSQPVDAGVYEVRVRTDLELCNYNKTITTEGSGLKLIINRRSLVVTATPAVAYYQNEFDPVAEAYLTTHSGQEFIPIGAWKYKYKVNDEWVDSRPTDSGTYEVKVSIDSINEYGVITGNYEGETLTTLTIKKGNADSTTDFEIIHPQPINNPIIKGHISYGQKLSEIGLTQGSGYTAKYMFRFVDEHGVIYYEQRKVEGRFLIADRLYNPDIDASVAAFVNEMQNKIMPVARYTSSTALYNTFVPDDLVNFNITTERVNITIVKGHPQFNNLLVEPLNFGDLASDLTLIGFSKEEGAQPIYSITEIVEIDGVTINPTVNGMPITGKLHYIDKANKILSAGQQLIAFRFFPDDQSNIEIVSSFNISVTVNKDELELEAAEREELGEDEFITRFYGSQFTNPFINIYKIIEGSRIKDNSFDLNYMYTDSEGNIVSMNSLTPAGIYTMKAMIVNSNYKGELEEIIVIEKVTPELYTAPITGTVTYGMDMSNLILINGIMKHPLAQYNISGHFEFKGIPPVPMQVGNLDYDVIFIPNDQANYNINDNLTIKIRVEKASAKITLSNLIHTYTGQPQRPSYTTNIVIRTDGENEYYVNLDEPGNEFTEFDRYLSVEFRYNTETGDIPINAGSYTLTAKIVDSCFTDIEEAGYIIEQADAIIIVDETSRVQAYNSGIITLKASVQDTEGNIINSALISQSFTTYNNIQLEDAPRDVGLYHVKLDIRDKNYKGSTTSTLTIVVSQLSIHNTVQTYGIKPPILVEYLPLTASCTISYQRIYENNQTGDITEMQPTNAGTYKIIIHFPQILNNGYTNTFEGELIIRKAQVELSYNGEFKYTYTGETRPKLLSDVNSIRVTPNALYTLKRTIVFYDPENEEFSDIEPTDVGVYIMKVTINDNNYEGEGQFNYSITKGTPAIRVNPIVAPIIFTDDGSQADIQGGEVIFNGLIKTGSYSLIENTMNLEVGTHNVRYCFMPDDYHNLNEIYGIVQVTVHQKDISEHIVFSGDDYVEYNSLPHYVSVSISTGQSVLIDVFYNRSKSAPRERGVYTVTAEIIDKNYTGQAEWDKQLVIREGEPMIIAPYLTDILINQKLVCSQIQGGYAYIKGTGEFIDGKLIEGTATIIPGTFSFINPNLSMNKANYRTVQLSFKPFASSNFSNVTFYAEIRVIGQNPVIGDVEVSVMEAGQTVYYGQKLNNFDIYFTNIPEDSTEGTLSFVDTNIIPKVGEEVKYRFTPTDADLYNIIEGQVSVNITKAHADTHEISAKAFYGQNLRQAVFSAVMTNRYNPEVPVDGNFELLSVTGFDDLNTILTVNNVMAVAEIIDGTPVLYGQYRFTSNNYQEIEGSVAINCYELVNNINISIKNTYKSYNALPLTVSDLDITTSFTQHPLYDENYIMTLFDKDGNISQGINVGVYTLVIEIVDLMYYGKKTIEFEITKADISDYLSLSYTTAEFGSAIAKPSIVVLSDNFGGIDQSNFKIEFKNINKTDDSYNETMPSQAGIYDVRVSVINNNYFAGLKLLSFTIEKKKAEVQVNGMIQNYGNVSPLRIISVEYGLVPTVTYYGDNYSRTGVVPTEAGDYIARVEIIDPNYTIKSGDLNYIEVNFKVLQANLTLREKPLVSDITYGQSLRNSVITGGLITYGENVTVLGHYTFLNSDNKPYAGSQSVSLVFEPYNKNFASLRIDDVSLNVLRANAEIIFTKLTSVYDGTNKKNAIKYVSDSDVEWEITFNRDGIVVEPINAGSYEIMVKVLSDNYQLGVDIEGGPVLEKLNAATFVIDKASFEDYSLPVPTSIVYGQSLASSTLNRSEIEGYGMVKYFNIDGFVDGTFSYVNTGLVLGDAGNYIVDIVFNPENSNNFNSFKTKISVEVLPASATIKVTNDTFEYGTPITLPTFTTNPGNLSVSHNIDILNQIVDCGVYVYKAWVVSPNYDHPENYIEFNITVYKKQVDLIFVNNDQPIEKYFTTYNKMLYAKAIVDPDDVLARDILYINQSVNITYYSVPKSDDIPIEDFGHTPPSNIGDYRVVAIMNHSNYYGTESIYYDINLGEIEEIYFDLASLEEQVYGNVQPPVINTKPSGVSYYIEYQAHGRKIPDAAGTYNITVYFNDPNFTPRHVSAMFKIQKRELTIEDIEVKDKVYDGVPSLAITGKINGVELGDEVKLNLEARTKDAKVNVGTHYVEITKYSISGLHANNYYLAKPYYAGTIKISEKKIIDSKSQSYITSSKGFTDGVTVEFKEIDSNSNRENIFTNILGSKATVQTFILRENGLATRLDERVKVYVKIPDEYLGVKNLKVTPLGDLANQNIMPKREGDYYTFYTDSSGEIAFSSNDFSYWIIGAISVVVVFVLGIIFLFWLNPRHKRMKTADNKAVKESIKRIKKGYYK